MLSKEMNKWHEGEPPPKDQRPKCPMCGKVLSVDQWNEKDEAIQKDPKLITRTVLPRGKCLKWQYHSWGHFCSQTCATRYANALYDMIVQGKFKLIKK